MSGAEAAASRVLRRASGMAPSSAVLHQLRAERLLLAELSSAAACGQAADNAQAPHPRSKPDRPSRAHIKGVADRRVHLHPRCLSELPHRCIAAGREVGRLQARVAGGMRSRQGRRCARCWQLPWLAGAPLLPCARLSSPCRHAPPLRPQQLASSRICTHRCLAYGSVSDSKHRCVTPQSCGHDGGEVGAHIVLCTGSWAGHAATPCRFLARSCANPAVGVRQT